MMYTFSSTTGQPVFDIGFEGHIVAVEIQEITIKFDKLKNSDRKNCNKYQ